MLNPPSKLSLHTAVCRAYMIDSLPLTGTSSHSAFSRYFALLQPAHSHFWTPTVCLPCPFMWFEAYHDYTLIRNIRKTFL